MRALAYATSIGRDITGLRPLGWIRSISPETVLVLLITAWGLIFLPRMAGSLIFALARPNTTDFEIFTAAATAAWAGGDPYSVEICSGCAYRYSPLFAYVFQVFSWLGVTAWAGLHFAAVFGFPIRIARIIPLLWPFWWDVGVGSNMIFVALFVYHALTGKRWAIAATLALSLLVPRPLMVPIVVLLLASYPVARLPYAVGALGLLAFSLGTGHLERWLEILVSTGSEIGVTYNVGLSALIGVAWVPIGLGLAAWLYGKGRIGLASLAISPYWLPYYLLMPLADLRPKRPGGRQMDLRSDPAHQAGTVRIR